MPSFRDQMGNTVEINSNPRRIVSIVPSQTELLYDLGLNVEVAGITKFCVRPESWFKTKTRVGGTKNVKIDVIHSLKPDLIIANKEENVREQVEELKRSYPVWVSDVNTLEDALIMIESIGTITGTFNRAELLAKKIEGNFVELNNRTPGLTSHIAAAYFIWKDPYMATGGDTFIHEMMRRCGFKNIFENLHRYPVVTIENIQSAGCELVLLSSEPFPFSQKHQEALQRRLPDTKILLVDGEMFSWYGSRLLHAPRYFEDLLRRIEFKV